MSEDKKSYTLESFQAEREKLQKALDERKKIYLDKYKLTDSGVCLFFINFNDEEI